MVTVNFIIVYMLESVSFILYQGYDT